MNDKKTNIKKIIKKIPPTADFGDNLIYPISYPDGQTKRQNILGGEKFDIL